MPKGQKCCDNCGHCTGPRAYMCPKCNTTFVFKVQSKEKKHTKVIKDFNWRDYQMSDKIFENYDEAQKYSFSVPWKLEICNVGKSCWCRLILPHRKDTV